MASSKSLNILCFGDSLTAGYSAYGMRFTPYSTWLKTMLEEELTGVKKVNVDTDGVSGELVLRGFRGRMEKRYSTSRATSEPYDWVIFLGGTNDLGWGKKPEEVWDEIKAVTRIPLEAGAKVLLMTVPQCHAKSETLDKKRDTLNSLITADERANVFTLDLHALMPYHTMSDAELDEIWDDGLHFKPAGYEKIGKLVAQKLLDIMKSDGGNSN